MDKDTELFLNAMETLGVRGKRGPGKAKPGEVAAPTPRVGDDGLDFDALMRGGRGPAKLMVDRAPRAAAGIEAPIEAGSAARPLDAGAQKRPDPGDYRATADEIALFERALAHGLGAPPDEPLRGRSVARRSDERFERDLKAGTLDPDAILDLHGRTREDAQRRLRAFLDEARRERWRVVAIVCGKGSHSERGEPVLKPFVGAMLAGELRSCVRRYVEAPRSLGGAGTWLVDVRFEASE
jgi:DNA-nicking Smr family endonuclease